MQDKLDRVLEMLYDFEGNMHQLRAEGECECDLHSIFEWIDATINRVRELKTENSTVEVND